jgi:hypothetical protein
VFPVQLLVSLPLFNRGRARRPFSWRCMNGRLLMRMITTHGSRRLASLIDRAKDGLGTVRYRNRYLYKRGTHRVPIDELISPLRYDVCVRMEYFRLYVDNRELFDQDFGLFVEISKNHPYFVWFKAIHCGKLHPELLRNEQTLRAAFSHRLRRSAVLYSQFRVRGFDKNRPIVLYACKSLEPTSTGKIVDRAVYMGNGCHRLALLKLAGHRWLESDMYVIRTFPTYSPTDNTRDLLPNLSLSSREYFRFLSLGYGGAIHDTKQSFLNHVLNSQPQRYGEVLQVIRDEELLEPGDSPLKGFGASE